MKWYVNFDAAPRTYIRLSNHASPHFVWFNAIKASIEQAIKVGLATRGNGGMCTSIVLNPEVERTYEPVSADLRIFVVFPEGQFDDSSLVDTEWLIGRSLQDRVADMVSTVFPFSIVVTPTHTPVSA